MGDYSSQLPARVFGKNAAAGVEELRLSELGNVNSDGIYDVSNNTLPNTSGEVGHTRNATPGVTHQVKRITAITGTTDTTHTSLDVAIHDGDGEGVDTANPLPSHINGLEPDDSSIKIVRVSELGNINGDGIYDVSNNSLPSANGVVGHTRNATPDATHQGKRITSITGTTDTTHTSLDVAIHDGDGEGIDSGNPLPVQFSAAGTPVHDYDTASSVAADATDDHEYSVANGNVFTIKRIFATSSSLMKIEVQIGDGEVAEAFTTKFVLFNSVANPVIDLDISHDGYPVTGTVNTTTIKIIRTNLDEAATDLYSTIVGSEE